MVKFTFSQSMIRNKGSQPTTTFRNGRAAEWHKGSWDIVAFTGENKKEQCINRGINPRQSITLHTI